MAGVVSPAARPQGAIWLEDLASGRRRLLAHVAPPAEADLGRWRFSPATVAWGNARLRAIRDTDLLLIDEIGPLELHAHAGLLAALAALRVVDYRLAVVTVRPALAAPLAEALCERHPVLLRLTPHNRDALPETLLGGKPAG